MRTPFVVRLLLILCVGGPCAGADSLSHSVAVPARFTNQEDPTTGVSDAERYRSAYEEGWWACIAHFAHNIEYQSSEFVRAGSGWPAALWGYEDGYRAAESRIQSMINQLGANRAQS